MLDDVGVGLAHALCRETDGNPFFTEEINRHLGETGGIALGDDGRWTVAGNLDDLALPRSVHDVVGRRVERLGEEAVRVLRLASVIGREFEVELLARVADIEVDPLLDLVDSATSAAVLVEGSDAGRCRFAHALIQHTLYDELNPARRQRAHQRIAEALESSAAHDDATVLAELARHWIAATRPSDIAKAITYARRAGEPHVARLRPRTPSAGTSKPSSSSVSGHMGINERAQSCSPHWGPCNDAHLTHEVATPCSKPPPWRSNSSTTTS